MRAFDANAWTDTLPPYPVSMPPSRGNCDLCVDDESASETQTCDVRCPSCRRVLACTLPGCLAVGHPSGVVGSMYRVVYWSEALRREVVMVTEKQRALAWGWTLRRFGAKVEEVIGPHKPGKGEQPYEWDGFVRRRPRGASV